MLCEFPIPHSPLPIRRMNPVLQRELTSYLRSGRTYALEALVLSLLGLLVVAAWPPEGKIDVVDPSSARRLIELFFAGLFVLASLSAPALAATALTGEKERKTYEMLLASALEPGKIVRGKWLASLAPSWTLTVASLPLVMLCLPLGGISFYEAAAAAVSTIAAAACFAMIGLTTSAYFTRTAAALTTAYLSVLPLMLLGTALWLATSGSGARVRLWLFGGVIPLTALITSAILYRLVCRRLWYPPDVGSEGRDVIDAEREQREAIGLVIRRDDFPDRLFAPAKRTEPLSDDANPVLDKELRSELFSHGTLSLRLVIQAGMLAALPLMGGCLYFQPSWTPWYFCYVLAFNLLVGPAFSAGTVTQERERRTLDLLLTTTLPAATILWGKLLGGLRVSGVLTLFLLWPPVLACLLVPENYHQLGSFAVMGLIVGLTCLLTPTLSLFCSVLCRATSTSLTTAYLSLLALLCLPPAASLFARSFFPHTSLAAGLRRLTFISPAATLFNTPLQYVRELDTGTITLRQEADWTLVAAHFAFQILLIGGLLILIGRLFRKRYDAESS